MISTAVYLLNISPTKSVLNKALHEALIGSIPLAYHLRVLKCVVFSKLNSHHLKNYEAKSIKCIFLGYNTELTAYKLYDPSSRKVYVNRNIVYHSAIEEFAQSNEGAGRTSSSDNNTPSSNKSDDDATPTKYRSIRGLYDNCTFALVITDPSSYEEATEKQV